MCQLGYDLKFLLLSKRPIDILARPLYLTQFPRQKITDADDHAVQDVGERVGPTGLWIAAIQIDVHDQGVSDGSGAIRGPTKR